MTEIYGLLIKSNGPAEFCKVEDELETYYRILDCDTIDIVPREIGGQTFEVICDDEALCKDPVPNPTIFDKDKRPMIHGSVFICRNAGPDMASISKEDEVILSKNLYAGILTSRGKPVDERVHWCILNAGYPMH